MNILELSIREAVAVKTGVMYFEIIDTFNQTTEVENARSIYFKLLNDYNSAHYSQLCVRFNLERKKLRAYTDRADKRIYSMCENWIYEITKNDKK